MISTTALLGALALVAGANAHVGTGCGGHGVMKRNMGGPMKTYVPRAAPSDVASAAQSLDPAEQCTAYSYQPVLDIESQFPAIWETASILPNDTEAQAIFATINATVNQKTPNSLPKGTPSGDHTGINYPNSDPDCWWTWRQCDTPADTSIPADVTTVPEPNTWGFGFDDGPNCSHNALYDMLHDNNQKATMFYIGSNVIDWPLQAMRGLADGHEICVHTWSHQYMTAFSNEVAFAELYYTRKVIKELLGVTPKCWRPPFGDIDNRIRVIAEGLNLTSILWNQDSEDWRIGTGNPPIQESEIDANYQGFIDQGKNGTWSEHGTIVLNHELNNFTMSEMVKYYSQLKGAYKALVPIQAAYNITTPYAEGNYSYPDFASYTSGNTNVTTTSASISNTAAYTKATGSAGAAASGASGKASGTASAGSSSSSSKTGAAGRIEVGGAMAVMAGLAGAALLL